VTDSLVYAAIQAAHNLGAALVLGAPLFRGLSQPGPGSGPAPSPAASPPRGTLALIAALWALQMATGTGFGLASLSFYGALPDLHPIAWGALAAKVACALAGLGTALWLLGRGRAPGRTAWSLLALLAAIALCAAAVLRWYS
jgi:hypothetical protein